MYSIIVIDSVAIIIPSEYVQPTNTVLAWGIIEKDRAYEILNKIRDKRIKRKIGETNNKEQKL